MPPKSSPEPRFWLQDGHRHEFGRVDAPAWKADPPSPSMRARREAAHAQHAVALAVRKRRGERGCSSWDDVARLPYAQMSATQLRAIMRGEAHMHLRHVIALNLEFPGLVLLGEAARSAEHEIARLKSENYDLSRRVGRTEARDR